MNRLAAPTGFNASVLLVVACACWAGNFVAGRALAGVVPPVTLAFIRWTGATVLILMVARPYLRRDWPLIRRHWPILAVLGLLGAGSYNTLLYVALVDTSATNAALITASGPVLIALAAYLLNGDRLRPLQGLGLVISLAGVVTVLTRGEPASLAAFAFNRGDLVMVAAVLVWAVYTALLPRRPAISGMSLAAVTYVVAAVFNAPLSALELASGAHLTLSPAAMLALLYIAVFPSFLAYLCYNRGVEIIGSARAGAFLNLLPLLTALLALALLGEQPHVYHAAGFVAIMAGVFLAAR